MPLPFTPLRCALLTAGAVLALSAHAETPEGNGAPSDFRAPPSITFHFPLADDAIVAPAVVGRPIHPSPHKQAATQPAKPAKPAVRKPARVERDAASTQVHDDVGKGTRMARQDLQPGAYIGERHRQKLRDYYARTYAGGKTCPAGVSKTPRGCAAAPDHPWRIGQPLPSGVAALPLPAPVMAQLPPTPPGYRYVQVAGDILLIAAGSKMVVDGVDGLLKL